MTSSPVAACRRRAEAADDLTETWKATVEEIALRWSIAGCDAMIWPREDLDHAMQEEVGDAMRRGDWRRGLLRIEAWRDVWIAAIGEPDLASTARLNVIAAFRADGARR